MDIVLLAAGMSKRMGSKNKLLLKWEDRTIVSHCVEVALEAVEKIYNGRLVVVTGYESDKVREAIKNTVGMNPNYVFIENKEYEKGQFSSLKRGVQCLGMLDVGKEKFSDFMVALGDMPKITVEDYLKLFDLSLKDRESDFIRPIFSELPGHPVVCRGRYRSMILEMDSKCKMRNLLDEKNVKKVSWSNDNVIRDFDTELQYNEIMDC